MDEINESPYSVFLEQAVRFVYENKPVSITLVAEQKTGEVLTAYYHSDTNNKMTAIMHILTNFIIDTISNNKEILKELLMAEDEESADT